MQYFFKALTKHEWQTFLKDRFDRIGATVQKKKAPVLAEDYFGFA